MQLRIVRVGDCDFIYLIFVILGGFSLSGAVLESGRRRMLDSARS